MICQLILVRSLSERYILLRENIILLVKKKSLLKMDAIYRQQCYIELEIGYSQLSFIASVVIVGGHF